MNKNNLFSSVFWAVAGVYFTYEGYRLQIGTFQEPKPGFLIFWAGLALFGMSLALFVQTFRAKDEVAKALWKGVRWSKVIKVMVALLAYALVFKWAGFLLSTFLLLLFLLKGLEPQKWSVAIAVSVATVILCYLIFGLFLESQFPGGILERIFSRWFSSLIT
jgi:putative tricarboxylic transport membrane protein